VNIKTIVEFLNKEKGYAIPTEHYDRIEIWQDWWKGFYKPFHEFIELNGDQSIKRKLFTLKMAKKVCEDWASILLNEKTEIVVDDNESNAFLQGEDGTGGVLGANDFWEQGNALVEKSFMSGTGAFVLKLSGMMLDGDTVVQDADTKIGIDYLPGTHIIPLTVRQRRVIEVAFVSETVEKGKPFLYLETHTLEQGQYVITNRYFSTANDQLQEQQLPAGVAPVIRTGSEIPWFAILSPNIVNTYDNAHGLGCSIYAHAIDNLMGVDLAFNNFCRDFKLGGKKVFYNDSLIRRDEKGRAITPDDVMQQLFVQIGDNMVDENGKQNAVQEYNPALRVDENKDGIQAQLDYLSFKVGFGTKHYQFNGGSIVTATQYTGDKQELVQNASKHYIVIERALQDLVQAILWAARDILGQPVNPDAKITINFEDSYIIDKESERLRDLQEIRDGIMQKYEYRMKWHGEDEATAKKMVGAQMTDDEQMGFDGGDE